MKRLRKAVVLIFLASGLILTVRDLPADLEVSGSVQISAQADFYAPLTPHGAWIEVDSFGRCWHPARVAVEWRPYCDGYWVWTDCGWYWVSEEPWAWACYHYGNWHHHPRHGWIWVPGLEWGPAWVSWRYGGGYVGWCPLPPRGVVFATAGVPAPFVFVGVNRFHERQRPATVIVNNTTIINQTTEINNVRRETKTIEGAGPRKVVVNEGPGLETIQQASGHKVKTVAMREAITHTPVPGELKQHKGSAEQAKPPQVIAPAPATPPGTAARPVLPGGEHRVEPPARPPKSDEIVPAPSRPPTPAVPPGKGAPPGKGNREGKGKGKDESDERGSGPKRD